MTIEKRLENLENLVNALSKKIDNNKFYADADTTSERKNTSENTSDISDNSLGLFDVAALADENSQAIMDLAELIAEKDGE